MATLPWTTSGHTAPGAEVVVMASRFRLTRWRDVPTFFLAALRVRAQMLAAPGVVGVSLIARPLRRTFYTLSAWQDRDALDSAVAGQPHAETMARFRTRMADSMFTFWHSPADIRPEWADALRRLGQSAPR